VAAFKSSPAKRGREFGDFGANPVFDG